MGTKVTNLELNFLILKNLFWSWKIDWSVQIYNRKGFRVDRLHYDDFYMFQTFPKYGTCRYPCYLVFYICFSGFTAWVDILFSKIQQYEVLFKHHFWNPKKVNKLNIFELVQTAGILLKLFGKGMHL